MKYQRAMHNALVGRTVQVRVRRATFDVVAMADEELQRLRTDLQLAAETLRKYEALHRAKGTSEADAKAEVNRLLAERFEATIRSTT